MTQKQPTIKEIAKKLNISVSSVSRALHDHPSIGLRTRLRVQQLAKEMNYEPNQTAIFFNSERLLLLALYFHTYRKVFSDAISGIEDTAHKTVTRCLLANRTMKWKRNNNYSNR